MDNVSRVTRLNQLLLTSIGDIVRKRFTQEGALITLTHIDCSPDLKNAKVYFSVLGDDVKAAHRFWKMYGYKISQMMAKDVILKRHPKLEYIYDDAPKGIAHIEDMLADMENRGEIPQDKTRPTHEEEELD